MKPHVVMVKSIFSMLWSTTVLSLSILCCATKQIFKHHLIQKFSGFCFHFKILFFCGKANLSLFSHENNLTFCFSFNFFSFIFPPQTFSCLPFIILIYPLPFLNHIFLVSFSCHFAFSLFLIFIFTISLCLSYTHFYYLLFCIYSFYSLLSISLFHVFLYYLFTYSFHQQRIEYSKEWQCFHWKPLILFHSPHFSVDSGYFFF